MILSLDISSFHRFLLQAQVLLKHVADEQAQSREVELRVAFLKKQKLNPLLWNNGSSVATSQ